MSILSTPDTPVFRRTHSAAFTAECVHHLVRANGNCPALLARWQQLAAITAPANQAEISQLRIQVRRMEQERDFLKKCDHLLPNASLLSLYAFIRTYAPSRPLTLVCLGLLVSRASYYVGRNRQRFGPTPTSVAPKCATAASEQRPPLDLQLVTRKTVFDHARRYSTRCLRAKRHSQGYKAGHYALRSWLLTNNFYARHQRPRATQADTNHKASHKASENMLLHRSAPRASDQIWVGDSTYLSLASGEWCYLATWCDAFSRPVVGWKIDGQMSAQPVVTALDRTLALRNLAPSLIVHTGREHLSALPKKDLRSRHTAKLPLPPRPLSMPKHKLGGVPSKPNVYSIALLSPTWMRLSRKLPPILQPPTLALVHRLHNSTSVRASFSPKS
jgi:transposase InsO family protein